MELYVNDGGKKGGLRLACLGVGTMKRKVKGLEPVKVFKFKFRIILTIVSRV